MFTRNAFYNDTESSYVARQLVVTDGKEPTPTTLRTQHMPPNSYTLPISVGPSLSRNGSTISESSYITSGMVTTYGSEAPIPTTMRTQRPLPVSVGPSLSRNGSTISESINITRGMVTTYGSEAPIPTTMRTQRPLPVSVGPSLSSKRSVNSESSYVTRGMVTTYGSEHTEAPMPTARRTLQPLIPSLSSKRSVNSEMITSVPAFEGRLTSSQSMAITSEAVSATTGGQKSGVMSSKMAPTELKTTTTTTTTTATTTTTTTTHVRNTVFSIFYDSDILHNA